MSTLVDAALSFTNAWIEVFISFLLPRYPQLWLSEMKAVYPYLPKLECFQDRTLYFSLLPRDILEYCVRPLLNYCRPRLRCAEDWIEPRLIQQLTLPKGFSYYNATMMNNGNLMILDLRGTQIQILDFSTNQLLWKIKGLQIRRYMYNDQDDILALQCMIDPGLISYQVKDFSRIRNLTEFFAALTISDPEEQYCWLTEKWKQTMIQEDPSYESKIQEMVERVSVGSSTIHKAYYRGGYIILMVRTSAYSPRHLIQVYQCLE